MNQDNQSTVPIVQSETPVISNIVDVNDKDIFFDDKPIKYYSWVTSSEYEATAYDKTIIDMLLSGHTYGECRLAVKEHYKKDLSVAAIKDRLENNQYARKYLEERLKVKAIAQGLTKDDYIAIANQILEGKKEYGPEQTQVFKHLSKVMGWEGSSVGHQNFTQINILQKDGRE